MPVGKQSVIVAVYPNTMDGLKGLDALQSVAKELNMTCQRILFEKLDLIVMHRLEEVAYDLSASCW